MTQHPDPGYGVAGSEPPLSYPLPDTAPANAEPPAGPDIVEWLAAAASQITGVSTLAAGDAQEWLRSARRSIEYLRDANDRLMAANASLRADNTRLNAELDAARGKEGR